MEKLDLVLEKLEAIEGRVAAIEEQLPLLYAFLTRGFLGLAQGASPEEFDDLLIDDSAVREALERFRQLDEPPSS
ncbi:hypothetical protein [Roseibacillus ishigakijimensis]|uniref:Uncharacterized protein n=1 Tax=Roseibacillus ishigakijimensis TaxID=454146 RepID=A0A934VLU1_9BACT|nr:hypothetical protein [Roseibacillus ishigakijimensis]MBK1835039.1 hypothetical protein [Roseibacillus ishigakijimensis]